MEEHSSLPGILRVLGSIPSTSRKTQTSLHEGIVLKCQFLDLIVSILFPFHRISSLSISESIHDKTKTKTIKKITFLKS